jgi:hypothetical protein
LYSSNLQKINFDSFIWILQIKSDSVSLMLNVCLFSSLLKRNLMIEKHFLIKSVTSWNLSIIICSKELFILQFILNWCHFDPFYPIMILDSRDKESLVLSQINTWGNFIIFWQLSVLWIFQQHAHCPIGQIYYYILRKYSSLSMYFVCNCQNVSFVGASYQNRSHIALCYYYYRLRYNLIWCFYLSYIKMIRAPQGIKFDMSLLKHCLRLLQNI